MIQSTPRICFPRIARTTGLASVRSGFTLFELILVLSVVVTIMTLSWPQMISLLRSQTVESNAEQVRQVLDRARLRAIEEGRVLQVRFEPNGRKYVLLPQDPVPEQTDSSSTRLPAQQATPIGGAAVIAKDPYRIYELEEGCNFHIPVTELTQMSGAGRLDQAWLSHLENPLGARDITWTAPILYYPDGSATDAATTVMDANRRYIKIWVRGLTGAVTADSVAHLAETYGAKTN